MLIVQRLFEYDVVYQFGELVDRLGFRVPGGVAQPYLDMSEFWKPKPQMPTIPRWLYQAHALAQHYGIPTRLLDWTRNPLVAAFFAVENVNGKDDGDVAVWALAPWRANTCPPCSIRTFVVDRCDIGYLHAQDALFTLMPDADEFFLKCGAWPQPEHHLHSGAIKKVVLRKSEGPSLKRLLHMERISKAFMKPSLENVRAALEEKWAVG